MDTAEDTLVPLRALVKARPNDPVARLSLAKALAAIGAPEAVAEARIAWSCEPNNATLAREVAKIFESLGDANTGASLVAETTQLAQSQITNLPVWTAPEATANSPMDAVRTLYLDLVEKVVCNWIYQDDHIAGGRQAPFDPHRRLCGQDIPLVAHSMIGLARLRHLRWAVSTVLAEDIPGDLMEAGVWRGGAIILMRAVLAAHEERTRRVWAVDSFAGLPPPDARFPQDADTRFNFHLRPELAVDLSTVRANVARYGLLDGQVIFLKGLFCNTLPGLAALPLALLRVDGDLYSSTTDVLEEMYPHLSAGGFVILDDYGTVVDSRRAVIDFRARHGITEPMFAVDADGVFWRKARPGGETPRVSKAITRAEAAPTSPTEKDDVLDGNTLLRQ